MRCWLQALSAALWVFFLGQPTHAAEEPVQFQRDIRPILSQNCFKCHGPAVQEAGLRLDERDRATRRKVIVPGNPADSKLVKRVTRADEERMPPPDIGEHLKPAQITLLRKWIAQGAEYTPHYAFIRPKQAPLPKVHLSSWPRNPIDYFILARLEKADLKPSSEADRPTLIRRLSLDLLGLLPTPKEVADFVGDARDDAYERLVDRLFASPHYGERQARHWLDVARYADSNGYTIDGKRSIWPWRDWVIAAYNQDMPFDQFTIEQLAGDLLPTPSRAQLIATGFHRNTPFNEEGGINPEQFRAERTVDRTNTTGTAWLGLTVGCAQCHTHKFDPISHKEYYQLYAFFNSLDEPKLSVPTIEQEEKLRTLEAEELALGQNDVGTKAGSDTHPSPKPLTRNEEIKLLAELEQEARGGWRACYPKLMTASSGAVLTGLEDRSVLVSGKPAPSDDYSIQSVAPETGIVTAVRVEALTHPSLPKGGPGRAEDGRFAVSEITFETDGVPHLFRNRIFFPLVRTVDQRESETILLLKKPYPIREGQAFVFTVRSNAQPLGRFRIAITFASERVLEIPGDAQKALFLTRKQRSPKDEAILRRELARVPTIPPEIAAVRKEIGALRAKIASTLVMHETAKPRPTNIHKRGDFLALGDAVQPGTFAVLPPLHVTGRPANRLDLARWLVSADNPLTARVVVNRIWQQYFGIGIVETENDFGMQGTPPSHPELFDWLAVEFVKGGWGQKRMHRLIVTSATYRQASKANSAATDPQDHLLSRQRRIRLDAEVIRDAALSASGLLNPKIGGPGVYPPQPPEIFAFTQTKQAWPESKGPDRYRRGMYTFIWRQSQHPLLTTFDAPDAQSACTRRNRSDTPLQALHLANDPTFLEFAKGLGERIVKEGPPDDARRIAYGFQLCFARVPNAAEVGRLEQYLKQQRQVNAGQAWTNLARVLLNLDEFVTRE